MSDDGETRTELRGLRTAVTVKVKESEEGTRVGCMFMFTVYSQYFET